VLVAAGQSWSREKDWRGGCCWFSGGGEMGEGWFVQTGIRWRGKPWVESFVPGYFGQSSKITMKAPPIVFSSSPFMLPVNHNNVE